MAPCDIDVVASGMSTARERRSYSTSGKNGTYVASTAVPMSVVKGEVNLRNEGVSIVCEGCLCGTSGKNAAYVATNPHDSERK